MLRRPSTLLLVACFIASGPLCVRAADLRYTVFLDGNRAEQRAPSGLERHGVPYISAVRAVRIFNGFLSLGPHGERARVTIDHRSMNFVVGNKVAYLEGQRIVLPAAPMTVDGDVYLPLVSIAKLASARVAIDRGRKIFSFRTGEGDTYSPPPLGPLRAQDLEDVQPSPAQALAILTTATVDASGMHAQAVVRNRTIKDYRLAFPSAKQFAFVLTRNGTEVWDSTSTTEGTTPSALVIGPLETKIFKADYPDFAKLGPGRYLLRVRLMKLIPLDLAPISIPDDASASNR